VAPSIGPMGGPAMPLYLLKSYLSIVVIVLALIGMYTMFEAFGRNDANRKFPLERLKKIHKLNGYIFISISLVIAYICLDILADTKAELSSRAVIHSMLSLYVLLLLMLKIVINRVYRQYYVKLQNIGIVLVLLVFGMVGSSGAYYLMVTDFGRDLAIERVIGSTQKAEPVAKSVIRTPAVKTDTLSIQRGQKLYEENCSGCHDPGSNRTIVGPGHKGIIKNEFLPVSHKPATPANVRNQLINPYSTMPSFDYLSEGEIGDLIAYLNTL
jgi:mono/diheme cytochrome c family protein